MISNIRQPRFGSQIIIRLRTPLRFVFSILTSGCAGLWRYGLTHLANQLLRAFVEADDRAHWIVGFCVTKSKQILHRRNKFGADLRNAPLLHLPRFKGVFNSRRTVSWLNNQRIPVARPGRPATQGPVVMSSGRWGAGGGNQMGALLVRQFRRFSRARSIAQRGFDAFFDASLPGVVDHGGGHGRGFDNLRIPQPAAAFSSILARVCLRAAHLPLRSMASTFRLRHLSA